MKKRLVSILLILSFVINLLPLSGCNRLGGFVSRGEWIEMLSTAFGMDSYIENTPFYSDVPADNEYFTYVQSAAEWQVLDIFTGDKLGVDKAVTCEQVAGTAAVAAGFLSDGETFNANAALDYARTNGIVDRDRKASRKMNQEDCEAAIAAAKKIYLSAPLSEKVSAVINPDLINLGNVEADKIKVDDNQVSFPIGNGTFSQGGTEGNLPDGDEITAPDQTEESEGTEGTSGNALIEDGSGGLAAEIETAQGKVQIKAGDVFTTPATPEQPFGVAYKVVSVKEENGQIIVETEEPTLEDLFEELSVHTTVSVDFDNAIWADGVGDGSSSIVLAKSDGNGFTIEFLGGRQPAFSVVPMMSKSFNKSLEFGNGSFKSSWTNKTPSALGTGSGAQAFAKSGFAYDGNPSIEDFGGSTDSWSKDLTVTNEFSGSYKILGTLSGNIDVTPEVDFSILGGLKTASVRVDSKLNSTLRIEGKLGNNLKIATIPIPIAATGLSVSVDLYLFVNASGHLEVRADLSSTAKAEYTKKAGIKATAESSASSSAEAAIDVNFGADLSASLDALGIKIINAGAKVGGELNAKAGINGSCMAAKEGNQEKLTYQEAMYINADLYVPIIDVYTGGNTLVGKLGLNKTWNIYTKANAKKITLVNEDWVFWEEVVLKDGEEVVETEESTAGDEAGVGSTDESRLRLSTYVISLENESKHIELDVYDEETAPDVVWASNDSSVATVDDTGLVSPVAEGATYIIVQLREDPSVYATCVVFVGSGESTGNDWEFLDPNMPTV